MGLSISAEGIPSIVRAGVYPLLNPSFDFSYRDPADTVRLFDYGGRIRIGSSEYTFAAGDIACIPAGTIYSISTPEPGKHWCVYFRDPPARSANVVELPPFVQLGMRGLYYREWIQHISRKYAMRDLAPQRKTTDLEVRFRLKTLLLALYNLANMPSVSRRGGRRNFNWDDLLAWVDENLQRPLSLPLLAKQANVSPATLARKFRHTYNTTLLGYFLNRRVDRAKALLANTTLTIGEVGSAVGIPDPQYFNKQFRKVTSMSPSRYREENVDYYGGGSGHGVPSR
jgi:AraC-like DNA-binding protein